MVINYTSSFWRATGKFRGKGLTVSYQHHAIAISNRHNQGDVCDTESFLLLYPAWWDTSKSGASSLRQHTIECAGKEERINSGQTLSREWKSWSDQAPTKKRKIQNKHKREWGNTRGEFRACERHLQNQGDVREPCYLYSDDSGQVSLQETFALCSSWVQVALYGFVFNSICICLSVCFLGYSFKKNFGV